MTRATTHDTLLSFELGLDFDAMGLDLILSYVLGVVTASELEDKECPMYSTFDFHVSQEDVRINNESNIFIIALGSP